MIEDRDGPVETTIMHGGSERAADAVADRDAGAQDLLGIWVGAVPLLLRTSSCGACTPWMRGEQAGAILASCRNGIRFGNEIAHLSVGHKAY